ncbi:cytochrome P450 [Streptomyces sp. NBC_01239]|uniref:cytochrome P450 n=1 Tax=Streptomyces sp. NBC_01239 TaxID=2903792 RepID=UPI00224F873F|nr:cytochrome P450 [Streptomyces sp. NBC_01239]MCX4816298.1 cytochrome P450 [Streptomyces sp. NBC_01239]
MATPTISLDRPDPYQPPQSHLQLQSDAPISWVRLPDGRQLWVLTRHEDVRTMLGDKRFSSDRRDPRHPSHTPYMGPDHRPQLIEMDPPDHTELRRSVVGEFTVARLAAWRPRIQEIVDEAIDALLAGPREVDLVEALSLPVPSKVISELLGVPYVDHDFFQENSADFSRADTTQEEKAAAVGNLKTYINGLVDEKAKSPGDDLLSRQLAAGGDPEAVRGLGFLLLIAGHETTANMISLSVATLLDKREHLAALRDNPSITLGAVEELLRYFTIAEIGAGRLALEDVEIAGTLIRAGEGVIGLTNTANRDASVFPAPDEIDFTRMARNHLAFGFGPHQCLGQNLARLELEIVLATLLRRVPSLRLAVPFEEIPFKVQGPNYGVHELKVAW